jgi:putative MATE family efflux protein
MLVNAVYTIVDRIYVGYIDPLAIGAVSITMPVFMALMAASMLIGVGANALFSIRLGQKRRRQVEKIMGHAFVLLFLIPAIVIAISLIFIDEILIDVLGASPDIFYYAKTYLQIILAGGIFGAMGPGINHFIRSDGHPKTSMWTQILGALINIILDPIFIFVFDWGIAGAAWATIISQFISFAWVMFYFNSGWTKLRFRLRFMKLDLSLSLKIMAIGFAPFSMQFAIAFVNGVLNKTLGIYGGDIGITSMGIVFSIMIVFFMPMQGLTQGVQPIIGYNFGANQFDRVKKTYRQSIIYATLFLFAGFIFVHLFPRLAISVFHNENDALMDLSLRSIKIVTLMMPLIGVQIVTANFFQAIGKPIQGTILSLSRQILFFVPLVIILPKFFGIDGIFYTFPISDVLSVTLSIIVMKKTYSSLKKS